MSSALDWWIIIVAVAAINFVSRLSFIAVFARVDMPSFVARALRFVPAAMLTAIVVPPVVFAAPATLAFSYTNPKLVAALAAAVVASRTKSVTLTIAAGMVALWATQWALGALS